MNAEDPLLNSDLDASFRAAHQALRSLIPPETLTVGDDADLQDVVDDLEQLVDLARENAAAVLGPTITWAGSKPSGDPWSSVTLQADLDGRVHDDPPGLSDFGEWPSSALARASRAYRRECAWDHAPGEAGIWLLSVAPYKCLALGERAHWTGTITGFVILHDRDGDAEYESLAHIWTAQAWRRRGVAGNLVREASKRFSVSRAEGPATDGGRLLLEACAPALLND
ncbi:MAG: hypothetical protein IR158_12660 [Cellulomonas sp.]|uniref:GNAT family N-acetyltransferase n=1 Tax=Cellulomonas sp. TaxID=40001 RepID=UPI001A0738F7|nr:GNAT family N-acetyltransferase [Cellulomonas sp.]MBF0688601.1 hypothetical protein [Cellulomonas sp.]